MGRLSSTFGGDAGMNDFAGPILRFARTLGRAWRRSEDFRVLVYLVVLLLLSGTLFYSIVEGWSPLDAFYFSATTLTTVGFGDLDTADGARQALHGALPLRGPWHHRGVHQHGGEGVLEHGEQATKR
jgi:hypothetical protein